MRRCASLAGRGRPGATGRCPSVRSACNYYSAAHISTPTVKFTVSGLTISSSWGNGHATPYRAIVRALARLGHTVTFYERDVHYYAAHRDLNEWDACELVLY